MDVVVAGGVESISLAQNDHANPVRACDPWLVAHIPSIYAPMLHTAEVVAERYSVSRRAQDEFAELSQARTAAAQTTGIYDDEIVPMTVTRRVALPLDKVAQKW